MHAPDPARYERGGFYRRCGRSGLELPAISLGLWHSFGRDADPGAARAMVLRAFDLGITHFDLANNYGPPEGAAEETFGRIFREDLHPWRDELVVATKAGYLMWPGPYGEWGSRKHMLSSLDRSLERMGLEYVDVFYHHRPDPHTPLEETMGALADAVRSGRALYAGLSNYDAADTVAAVALLREMGTPCLVHQARYNLTDRGIESDLLPALEAEGVGCLAFSPLARGLLTDRYLEGIPADARAARDPRFLRPEHVTDAVVERARRLDALARERGQSLARMALAWVLRHPAVTGAVVGASRPSQIEDAVRALDGAPFTAEELARIEDAMAWRVRSDSPRP